VQNLAWIERPQALRRGILALRLALQSLGQRAPQPLLQKVQPPLQGQQHLGPLTQQQGDSVQPLLVALPLPLYRLLKASLALLAVERQLVA